MTRLVHTLRSCISTSQLVNDTRAASFNVGYIITVGITAVLIIGLIAGVGGVLDSQQDRAVNHQVDVIGDQVASGVMSTDRLGGVGAGANVTVTRDLPSQVVGTPYSIHLIERPDGDFLVVDAVEGEYRELVPIQIKSDIEETTVPGGETIEIVHVIDRETGDRTMRIQLEDQPPVGTESEDTEYFAVSIEDITPDPAENGDTVTVDAQITNTGSEEGTQAITLDITGFGEVDTEGVSLDPGEQTTVSLQWDDAERTSDFEEAIVESDDASAIQSFEVQAEEGTSFLSMQPVSISDKTDEEEFTVDVSVEEENDVETEGLGVVLEVQDPSGNTVYAESIDADEIQQETTTVTFGEDDGTPELGPYPAEAGEYTVTASAGASNSNTVSESTAFTVTHENDPAAFDVSVTNAPGAVSSDEDYVAEVTVENTGEQEGTQSIALAIDGEGIVDEETVTDLAGGDSTTITLMWGSDEHSPGDYTGSVSSEDTSDSVSFTVEEEESDRPEFAFVDVTDSSTDWPPGQSGVEYIVDFGVDDPEDQFDRVEIEFTNLDAPGASEQFTVTSESGSVTHDSDDGDFGDEYEITVRLYDIDGEVEGERVVIEDTADGSDP